MSLRMLETVADVVKALGGPTKAGRLVGKSAQSISNAANAEPPRLPPDCYLIMLRELERLGFTASSALWRITPPHCAPASEQASA